MRNALLYWVLRWFQFSNMSGNALLLYWFILSRKQIVKCHYFNWKTIMLSTIERWSKDVAYPRHTESGCKWLMHYVAHSDDICLLDNVISPVLTEILFLQIADSKKKKTNGILVFENVLPCLRNGDVVRRSQNNDKRGGVGSTKPSSARCISLPLYIELKTSFWSHIKNDIFFYCKNTCIQW